MGFTLPSRAAPAGSSRVAVDPPRASLGPPRDASKPQSRYVELPFGPLITQASLARAAEAYSWGPATRGDRAGDPHLRIVSGLLVAAT